MPEIVISLHVMTHSLRICAERLKKPQGGDNWDETLSSGYDITIGVSELTAAMVVCSRPTQDQAIHHPSIDGVGTCESSMLAE